MEFYCQATGGCTLTYRLDEPDLYGGPSIVSHTDISDGFRYCEQWGKPIAEGSAEAGEMWLNAVPFIAVCNGDVIAFDMRNSAADPPVIYLDHEGEYHRPLAKTFAEFLFQWEQVYYIGPEIWMLEDWTDPATGYLDHTLPAATELKSQVMALFK